MSPVFSTLLLAAMAAEPSSSAIDFDTDVLPVLTKAGCNAGACHGAAAGRGEFRLSLWGSNPNADYRSIVRELSGRRVNTAHPTNSLLVRKPTEDLGHGGGQRIEPGSDDEKLLLAWIAGGARRLKLRQLKSVEVQPLFATVDGTGDSVDVRPTATFDDGTTRDVTRHAVFTPADPASVSVTATGTATVKRRGQHVLIVRYLDRVVPVQIVVPFGDEDVPLAAAGGNFIDAHINRKIQQLRLPASPAASNERFLRRVTLDLAGRLPTISEHEEFVKAAGLSAERARVAVVDRLLASESFVDHWTFQLAKLLRIGRQKGDSTGDQAFHAWVREQLKQKVGWDQMVRRMLEAQGDTHTLGPVNFHRIAGGPREEAEFASEALLGVRLRCANCHNHPLDRWTQDDYHGFAAVFARMERGRIIKPKSRGFVTHPLTGDAAIPRLPGERNLGDDEQRLASTAKWLTDSRNRYFAKAFVNRLWKRMMGRGLIEPVDDLSETNPATHPQLLDALAADFIANRFNPRHTLRQIALSGAYRRSSLPTGINSQDDRFYSRALVRPLEAEVLADAVADVTGVGNNFDDGVSRAVKIVSVQTPSRSLDVLGRCARDGDCESGAPTGGGIPAKLHLLNGPLVNERLASKTGWLMRELNGKTRDSDLLKQAYRRAYSRRPSTKERAYWLTVFAKPTAKSARAALWQDIMWSVLNSKEFVTNH